MDRAKDLFEKIKKEGVSAIEELILTRKSEELFLDFKQSSDNGSRRVLSDEDRKNLAKAVSGFGNSAVGVIIWGLQCSPGKDGADVVDKKAFLQDAKKFVSLIENAISGVTLPPHQGVENFPISINKKDEGYVATYIPGNQSLPLQTISKNQFYIRAGSSFMPTPYNVLANMFGKKPQPIVFVNYTISPATITRGALYLQAGFMIHNRGPGIAEDLFLNATIKSSPGDKCILAFATPDSKNWTGGFTFGCIMSLLSIRDFRIPPKGMTQPLILQATLMPPFTKDLEISIMCGSGNSTPMESTLGTTSKEIESIYQKYVGSGAYTAVLGDDGHAIAQKILHLKGPKL